MALPRIGLVQFEVAAGRPDHNARRMIEHVRRARDEGIEVVAFPEMAVPGYILGDLWEVDAFVEDFIGWGDEIVSESTGIAVLFGNVAMDPDAIGEDGRTRKFNAVWVANDGRLVERLGLPAPLPPGIHPKTLHPNYRFFDDDRHFYSVRKLADEAGVSVHDWLVPFQIDLASGDRFAFGVQLCEDIWYQDYRYRGQALGTLAEWARRGAEAVFNLSSSPWTWQKNDKRHRTIRDALGEGAVPFFYVNHVGAQNNGKNILVFDGDTTAYAADGTVVGRVEPWREGRLDYPSGARAVHRQTEIEAIHDGVIAGLRHLDHLRGQENRFLVGVSGGIDSSVVTCLLEKAFGPERVFAVNMPTRFNSDVTRDNARSLCEALDVDYLECPIQEIYERLAEKIRATGFARRPGEYGRLVDENIQARIRGADILAGIAAKCGLVFTNNGNKTEVALGYATLYGDVNGAVAPIADLYKTRVFELARHLNALHARDVIPVNLIDGQIVPSAELSEFQDVTKGLGDPIKYGYHDAVLRQLIEYRHHPVDFLDWYAQGTLLQRIGWDEPSTFEGYFPTVADWISDLEWVYEQMRINVFKRIQAPPIVILTKRAFGFDLRESQLPAHWPRRYLETKQALLDA